MSDPSSARIAAARELLAQAKKSGKFGASRAKTKQDEVRLLRDDIEALRAEGATWNELAAVLKPVLNVGPDTIRLAINSGRRTEPDSKNQTNTNRFATASKPKAKQNKKKSAAENKTATAPEAQQRVARPASSNHPEHAATRRDGRKP
jgi:hypothetical protein